MSENTYSKGEFDMKCEDCNYFWQEEDEERPSCKFDDWNRYPGELAPCEEEDYEQSQDEEWW